MVNQTIESLAAEKDEAKSEVEFNLIQLKRNLADFLFNVTKNESFKNEPEKSLNDLSALFETTNVAHLFVKGSLELFLKNGYTVPKKTYPHNEVNDLIKTIKIAHKLSHAENSIDSEMLYKQQAEIEKAMSTNTFFNRLIGNTNLFKRFDKGLKATVGILRFSEKLNKDDYFTYPKQDFLNFNNLLKEYTQTYNQSKKFTDPKFKSDFTRLIRKAKEFDDKLVILNKDSKEGLSLSRAMKVRNSYAVDIYSQIKLNKKEKRNFIQSLNQLIDSAIDYYEARIHLKDISKKYLDKKDSDKQLLLQTNARERNEINVATITPEDKHIKTHDYSEIMPAVIEDRWTKLKGIFNRIKNPQFEVLEFGVKLSVVDISDSARRLIDLSDKLSPWQHDLLNDCCGDDNLQKVLDKLASENGVHKKAIHQNKKFNKPNGPVGLLIELSENSAVIRAAIKSDNLEERLVSIPAIADYMEKDSRYKQALTQLTEEKLDHNIALLKHLKTDSSLLITTAFGSISERYNSAVKN